MSCLASADLAPLFWLHGRHALQNCFRFYNACYGPWSCHSNRQGTVHDTHGDEIATLLLIQVSCNSQLGLLWLADQLAVLSRYFITNRPISCHSPTESICWAARLDHFVVQSLFDGVTGTLFRRQVANQDRQWKLVRRRDAAAVLSRTRHCSQQFQHMP